MILISIIIPVYNSEDTLILIQQKIKENLKLEYEIIFVNDGSYDNSWETIENIAKNNSEVTGINFNKNFGQDNAIIAGLSYTKGEYVVIMDDTPPRRRHLGLRRHGVPAWML